MNPYRAPSAAPAPQPEPVSFWFPANPVLRIVTFPLWVLCGAVLVFVWIMIELGESQRLALGGQPRRPWPSIPPPERDESLPPWARYKDDRPRRWDGEA